MLEDRRQDRRTVTRRRAVAPPLVFVDQIAGGALKEEHADLPFTASLDV